MNRKSPPKQKRLNIAEDLIENLPIGMMLLDEKGQIIRMNKKQEETSQIRREEVLGRTFQEAFPRTLEQGVKEPYLNLLTHGVPFDIIIDHYIPQYYSKQITYRTRGTPLPSKKYFILLHEHSQALDKEKRLVEKKTEELQESKNFLESLIDSSPNIVISTDLDDHILIFNKTAERVFGYTKEEVIKRKIDFLFLPKLQNGKNPQHLAEVTCIKKALTPFPASLIISDIKNMNGYPIAKLYLLSDLTEKKEMEERLFLSEKLALYTELMGGIAHQLNNPLIGVVNFSEMLLKEMEEEDSKRELAQTISKAGKECLRIITSVLNSIKDPYLTFSKTDIHEVLRDSILTLRDRLIEKLEKVSIQITGEQHILPIIGDALQLKQCFLNILINAIQAMPNGGNLRIAIGKEVDKKQIKISIADDGIGIPREYLNKIFLPFFSLKKRADRHGLGLSFAYQIIKNHGGNIYVESEFGKGSTFTIILPSN